MTTIRSIACALPKAELTNEELDRRYPAWKMELVSELSGIESRRVAAPDETAFDLSLVACEELLQQADLEVGDVDAILYCTPDPDHPMPGNAHLLHARLGLSDSVLAFDYRLACSGFVYGLAFADAFLGAGMATGVLLVTAETPSKRTNPGDRSVRTLFGDGAAATFLSADGDGGRIVAHELCSHGSGFEYAYVPAGGARRPADKATKEEVVDASGNIRTAEDFHMEGTELWSFLASTVPGHVEAFVARHGLTLDQIDLFIFHQASALILSSITKALSLPPARVFVHMKDVGNLSSASVPFALRAALDQRAIRPGDRVLLSGFGAGVSYGSAMVQY